MDEEVWQDAQGQPEDFSPFVADTQHDTATDENDQVKKNTMKIQVTPCNLKMFKVLNSKLS